jgi:hypothetical protein
VIDFTERPPIFTPPEPRPRWRTTTVIPFIRRAWLLDDDDIIELETAAVLYHLESESTIYLARIIGSVGTLSEFAGGDVVFSEGDALKIRTLRQRDAQRTAELLARQRAQCDEAISDLMRP